MCFSFTEIQTCLAYEAVQTVTWSLVFQKSLLTLSSRCCWCSTLKVEVASFSEATTTFNRQDAVVSEDLTFFNVRERSSYFSVRLLLFTLRVNQPLTHAHSRTHTIYSAFLCCSTPAVVCVDYMPLKRVGEVAAPIRGTAGGLNYCCRKHRCSVQP